jgi:hypothetical protein
VYTAVGNRSTLLGEGVCVCAVGHTCLQRLLRWLVSGFHLLACFTTRTLHPNPAGKQCVHTLDPPGRSSHVALEEACRADGQHLVASYKQVLAICTAGFFKSYMWLPTGMHHWVQLAVLPAGGRARGISGVSCRQRSIVAWQ